MVQNLKRKYDQIDEVFESISQIDDAIEYCKYNQNTNFIYLNYKIKVLEILLVMVVILFLSYLIKT
jgi:hypothetical protein